MPLKISLKPGEKFVLNGAVIENGDRRANLVLKNKASVLREKDILQEADVDTPVKRIYFPIMMMYLSDKPNDDPLYNEFVLRMNEFMGVVSDTGVLSTCVSVSRDVAADRYTGGKHTGIRNDAHEFIHAKHEFIVQRIIIWLVRKIHHHDGEIDALDRRIDVSFLEDVLLAQHRGLVLQDKVCAPVAILDDGPVEDKLLAGFERDFKRHALAPLKSRAGSDDTSRSQSQ